ncbi:MAG TPA: hypothetical protein VGU23_09965 [Acidobacteriaceae bacterium]|nr:hypothetical protein [Acidobacteriaceae bacterium]
MANAVVADIQQRTLADKKASSGIGLRMMADAFGLPDKEEVDGSSPSRPTQLTARLPLGAAARRPYNP